MFKIIQIFLKMIFLNKNNNYNKIRNQKNKAKIFKC